MIEDWTEGEIVKTRKIEYKEDRFEDPCTGDLSEDILDKNLRRRETDLLNNIWEHLEPNRLCIQKAIEFSEEVYEDFQIEFVNRLNAESKRKKISFSDDTIDYIIDNDYLKPKFDLITNKQRGRILERLSFERQHIGDSVILIFELPEILLGSQDDKDIPQDIIAFRNKAGKEWENLRKALIQSVWWNIRKYNNGGEVLFKRLNQKKEHDPGKYYYVWKIGENKINKEEDYTEDLNETTPNNNQQHP